MSTTQKDRIIEILKGHTREMEGYSYFSSNPGISEDDYEEIADEILADPLAKQAQALAGAREALKEVLEDGLKTNMESWRRKAEEALAGIEKNKIN